MTVNLESGVMLSDLNSRFANIVTRNASIVDENQRLQEELAQQGNNHKEELGRIKTFYEAEVKESHKLLNDAANEAFKMRQELESTVEKKNEAERKYEEKNLSERTARQLAEELQKEVDDMKAEQTQLRRKHQDLDAQKMSLNAQLVEAKSDADKFRNQLADEKVKLNQKNNELQSLQEKFETELRVRDVEIDEARKNQSSMLQQSLNMKSTHEESMSIAIDNIRDEHERDVKRLQKKFKSTQELLLAKRDEASKNRALMEQAIASKAKLEQELKRAKDLNLSLEADLASKNSLAKEEIADLKAKLADETEKVAKLEDIFRQKKEQYLAMEKECLTYRQLLEVEEARLNITPSPIRRKRGRAETRLSDCQTPAQKKSKSADNTLQEVDVSEIGATDSTRPDASCFIM
ncbi:Oidioi.mRNA.OKI2018_I69.PAR.g12140.t1.cds [Oikopleura dioica]|uniref:Oidioi.mRNA.OKI2018_I69.PAR.g12140.t1.cds n=1 Tax=Oikopleura dioica TaxID=34765 RepID=A0ABN7RYT6_OIKDI|nr:Oidioi.mRNA.OKI2018_I69.PAR.g12140.t1.cds [Oikopleura dioica]